MDRRTGRVDRVAVRSAGGGQGVVQAFRRTNSIYESARLKLRGLDAQARYAVTDLDRPDAVQKILGRGVDGQRPVGDSFRPTRCRLWSPTIGEMNTRVISALRRGNSARNAAAGCNGHWLGGRPIAQRRPGFLAQHDTRRHRSLASQARLKRRWALAHPQHLWLHPDHSSKDSYTSIGFATYAMSVDSGFITSDELKNHLLLHLQSPTRFQRIAS